MYVQKKLIILTFLLILVFAVPVYAATMPAPINVEQKNVDGNEYLIKTYETVANFDPNDLIEDGFENNGFLFTHLTTKKQPQEKKLTKEVAETVKTETESKDLDDILKQLPSTKSYETEGFTGTLALDTASILTEVSDYTTKTSTISTTQEYPGLMYADPTYVPQLATKNGVILPLVDVQWVVTGSGLAGDTLVPTEYKATATYSKQVSSQVPNGYVTTAEYRGIAEKTVIDCVLHVVTYIGAPIIVPEPTPEPVLKESFEFPWGIVLGVFGIAAVAGGGVFLFFFLKSRRGVKIYNLIDKDYICVGRQTVDYDKPVIDLNPFKDVIQSNSFAFVVDKTTTNKLFGRNIAVTLDDVTIMHMVKGHNEEYRFNLELGGILDVE